MALGKLEKDALRLRVRHAQHKTRSHHAAWRGKTLSPRGLEGNSLPQNVGESSILSAVAGISCLAALALNPGVVVDEVLQSLPTGGDEELAVQLDIPEASQTNSMEAKPEEVLM